MPPPAWTDPLAWARAEATPRLHRGLAVYPTLVLFEGESPTVHVRCGPRPGADRDEVLLQASAFAARLGAPRVLAVHEARLSDPGEQDLDVRLATGDPAVAVEWCAADGGRGWSVLPYGIADDGTVTWGRADSHPDAGALGSFLDMVVEPGAGPLADMAPADVCYAVSRQGIAIGVHPDWRAHYGLDRVPAPRGLRPVDRRRAHRLRRARRLAQQEARA